MLTRGGNPGKSRPPIEANPVPSLPLHPSLLKTRSRRHFFIPSPPPPRSSLLAPAAPSSFHLLHPFSPLSPLSTQPGSKHILGSMHTADESLANGPGHGQAAGTSQSAENETGVATEERGSNAVKSRTVEDFLSACGFEEVSNDSEGREDAPTDNAPAGSRLMTSNSDPPSPPPAPPPGFLDEIRNAGPPISLPAEFSSNRRVAVFDFDQTLAVTQTTPSKLVDAVRRVFGGEGRVRMLRDLFEKLDRLGVIMVVASFNSKETIERALSDPSVDLLHFFRHPLENLYRSQHYKTAFGSESQAQAVIGAELFDDIRDYRKSAAVAKVLSALGAAPENLLFVDDNSSNCKDVEERVPGARTMRIGMDLEQWGITPLHCLHILQWAGYEPDDANSGGEPGPVPELEEYYSSTGTCSGTSSNRSDQSMSGLEAGLADLNDDWETDLL